MRDLLNLAIVLGTPVMFLWLIFSRRPGTKVLCLLGRHDFKIAHGHPDGKLGYCIHECTGCSKAVVSDPSLGGSYPILNTQAAIERDASKAALPAVNQWTRTTQMKPLCLCCDRCRMQQPTARSYTTAGVCYTLCDPCHEEFDRPATQDRPRDQRDISLDWLF